MVVLSEILFRLAEEIDGKTDGSQLAERLSGTVDRPLGEDDVHYLIDHKLGRLGITAEATEQAGAPAAVLTLAGRTALIPARTVGPAADRLRHLFRPPIVAAVLAAAVAMNALLLRDLGFSSMTEDILAQPLGILSLGLVAVLSALFHELGHASASSYGGAPPGAIGAGIYVVWPVFFTDITESYRLNRLGRVRTDLGGIYFNLLLTLPLGSLYLVTGNPLWRWAALAQFLIILQQCLPFLRLDGYYLVSDLTGVPDLFGHLRPALAGLVPGREVDAGVARLRPKVRIAVTAWAMGTVAFIAWFASVLVLGLPALAETAWSLATSLGSAASANLSRGRYGIAGAAVIQLLLVSIQFLGLAVVLKRIVRRRRARPVSHNPEVGPQKTPSPASITGAVETGRGWVQQQTRRGIS